MVKENLEIISFYELFSSIEYWFSMIFYDFYDFLVDVSKLVGFSLIFEYLLVILRTCYLLVLFCMSSWWFKALPNIVVN